MTGDDRLLSAVLLRLTSAGLFSCMSLLIKLAEGHGARLGEILFFRQFGAALLIGAVVAGGPGIASLRTQRMAAHLLRAAMGLAAMALTFSALLMLPLAEATTIGFSMPIFATILGALILREPTGWRRWAAVAAGFAGVLIVAHPAGGSIPPAGVALGLGARAVYRLHLDPAASDRPDRAGDDDGVLVLRRVDAGAPRRSFSARSSRTTHGPGQSCSASA